MLFCNKCNVNIRGSKAECPLCGSPLIGTPEDPAFPVLPPHKHTLRSVFKVIVFAFLVLMIVMGTLRYMIGPSAGWATAVMLWSPLGLAGVFITMTYRNNILKLISAEFYSVMVLDLLIDLATGWYGWSVAFVIPSCFVALVIVSFFVGRAVFGSHGGYLMYLITAEILSFFQIFFILADRNPFTYIAVAVMALMLILFLAEMIFFYQDFKNATSRTLHI
ncbi:MAG: hypothetical protein K6B72_00730 [Lachnospiraceae bacterium]|nr:hypothetical protein [Lachnospiraceae bacterium]